jgi:hypothetical protein
MTNVGQESSSSRPYFRAGHIAITRNPGLIDTQRLPFLGSVVKNLIDENVSQLSKCWTELFPSEQV